MSKMINSQRSKGNVVGNSKNVQMRNTHCRIWIVMRNSEKREICEIKEDLDFVKKYEKRVK